MWTEKNAPGERRMSSLPSFMYGCICIYHGSTRTTYRPNRSIVCVIVYVCVRACVCVYGYITACSLQALE